MSCLRISGFIKDLGIERLQLFQFSVRSFEFPKESREIHVNFLPNWLIDYGENAKGHNFQLDSNNIGAGITFL